MASEKETSIDLLKYFLKEMFQFNTNDLDFGIYRIYNLKRKEIENFIDGDDENCLKPIIYNTLELVVNNEKKLELSNLGIYLKKFNQEALLEKVQENFKQISLFIETNNNDSEKEELLFALNSSSKDYSITDEIKDKIYNHILGFFEMYYSNGDFGYNNRSRNLYKVPYEADYDGTDTLFHWKHKGSIYIKTGNSFNAIKFKLKHLDQEFELRLETNEESSDEEVARNNNKDTKLKHYKFNRFEVKDGVTRIVFNLSDSSTTKEDLFKFIFKEVFKSEEDITKYLKAEEKDVFNNLEEGYDKVLDGSVKGIGVLRVKRKTLLGKVNKNFGKGEKIELLDEGKPTEHFSDNTLETIYNIDQKLNSFYIGNDSDYFIHENLQEFLTNEKERYIKNHILSDLESILNGKLDNTTIIIAKAFELVSSRIIEFLSAIEEFQKRLFTMKKKVLESEYCFTIDNIDEKLYKDILNNKAQLAEWENLFSVKVKTIADLKAQPTLVLDTKFFREKNGSNPFKDKILEAIENLDEKTNGVLINSENFQALDFIEEKYLGSVKCLCLDPPYNTGNDGFQYKDNFKNSSWISFMQNRLKRADRLLNKNSCSFIFIDDHENDSLASLCNQHYGSENFLAKIIWQHSIQGKGYAGKFSVHHNYIHSYKFSKDHKIGVLDRTESDNTNYSNPDNDPRGLWRSGDIRNALYRKNCVYDVVSPNGKIIKPPANGWRFKKTTMEAKIKYGSVRFNKGETALSYRIYLEDQKGRVPETIWFGKEVGTTRTAKATLKNLFKKDINFSTPKPPEIIEKIVQIMADSDGDIFLDFFAGSGSTGHAVIKSSSNQEVDLRYVLVEMEEYFNSLTKPRIQKVIYSENWKDGKPIDNQGYQNHIFKYLVLEQYEDVLDAIEKYEGNVPKNLPLKYLYKPELNKLNSTLDLSKPFSNRIRYGQPTKEGFVDLVETYNYLQGHEVKRIKSFTFNKKYYKIVETLSSLVIWRDISLGEDDSKTIIAIAEKYPEANSIEINFDFNLLSTQKGKQLIVGKRELSVSIIHSEIFNQ